MSADSLKGAIFDYYYLSRWWWLVRIIRFIFFPFGGVVRLWGFVWARFFAMVSTNRVTREKFQVMKIFPPDILIHLSYYYLTVTLGMNLFLYIFIHLLSSLPPGTASHSAKPNQSKLLLSASRSHTPTTQPPTDHRRSHIAAKW